MSRTLIIARRELSSMFLSPVAYFVMFLTLLPMGIIFGLMIFVPREFAEVRFFFTIVQIVLFVVTPPITMGLFAEEYKSGRMEMLRTSPITEPQLIFGKFFGALGFYCVLLATSFVFVILLSIYGRIDFAATFTSYLGMILIGAFSIAIGLFFSACTQSQIIAFMASTLTLGCLISLQFAAKLIIEKFPVFGTSGTYRAIEYFSPTYHTADFLSGAIGLPHVVYFFSGTGLFIFLTYLILESRRWR